MAALSVHKSREGISREDREWEGIARNSLRNSEFAATPPARAIVFTFFFWAALNVFVTRTSTQACWKEAAISATFSVTIGRFDVRVRITELTTAVLIPLKEKSNPSSSIGRVNSIALGFPSLDNL